MSSIRYRGSCLLLDGKWLSFVGQNAWLDYGYQELADAFGLQHYGGASYTVYAIAQELQKDCELEAIVSR